MTRFPWTLAALVALLVAPDAAGAQQARTGCFALQGPEDGPALPASIQIVIHDPHGETGRFRTWRDVLAGGFVLDQGRLHVVFMYRDRAVVMVLRSEDDAMAGHVVRVGEREPPSPDAWPVRAEPEPCRGGS